MPPSPSRATASLPPEDALVQDPAGECDSTPPVQSSDASAAPLPVPASDKACPAPDVAGGEDPDLAPPTPDGLDDGIPPVASSPLPTIDTSNAEHGGDSNDTEHGDENGEPDVEQMGSPRLEDAPPQGARMPTSPSSDITVTPSFGHKRARAINSTNGQAPCALCEYATTDGLIGAPAAKKGHADNDTGDDASGGGAMSSRGTKATGAVRGRKTTSTARGRKTTGGGRTAGTARGGKATGTARGGETTGTAQVGTMAEADSLSLGPRRGDRVRAPSRRVMESLQ